MNVTIYHNPDCGTSRNTLAMIRQSGAEPTVIEYLKTPPSRETLKQLIAAMGITVRGLLREKGTPYKELGLADPKWTDDQLIDQMLAHPILINRPIVVTSKGTRLCRPSEAVVDLLDNPVGRFTKASSRAVTTSERPPQPDTESSPKTGYPSSWRVTWDPTAITVPETSDPITRCLGRNGAAIRISAAPITRSTSHELSETAATRTATSPGPGTGRGSSARRMTCSGCP